MPAPIVVTPSKRGLTSSDLPHHPPAQTDYRYPAQGAGQGTGEPTGKRDSVNVNYARGLGRITPLRHRGLGETTEKAVVTVLVEEERADEVFEFIFYEAEINQPHGGLMFQQPLLANTLFKMPDIEEEK